MLLLLFRSLLCPSPLLRCLSAPHSGSTRHSSIPHHLLDDPCHPISRVLLPSRFLLLIIIIHRSKSIVFLHTNGRQDRVRGRRGRPGGWNEVAEVRRVEVVYGRKRFGGFGREVFEYRKGSGESSEAMISRRLRGRGLSWSSWCFVSSFVLVFRPFGNLHLRNRLASTCITDVTCGVE
jgi:hypothetical protein